MRLRPPPHTLTFAEISRSSTTGAQLARLFAWTCFCNGLLHSRERFGAFVSEHEIPFPGSRDFGSKRPGSNKGPLRGKTEHLMLAGPFSWRSARWVTPMP
jgi:hypothetical protein